MFRTSRFAVALIASMITALGVALPASASTSGTGDWPMFMDGPAHNGDNRAETSLSPSTVPSLHVTYSYTGWNAFDGEGGAYPVVAGNLGASLTTGGGNRVALSVFTLPAGTLTWRHLVFRGDPLPASPVPAISQGNIFVGIGNTVYAYNLTTGHLVWKQSEAPGISFNQTVVSNQVVYLDSYSSPTFVYALSASTGSLIWSASLSDCCAIGAVSVAHGIAYVSLSHLWAFNATTGAHVFTSASTVQGGTPAISNGVVYVENVNTLKAFNATTGGLIWSKPTVSGNSYSSLDVAIDASTVVAATEQYVIAFNASTGARVWTYDSGGAFTDYGPPAIANGVVYEGSIADGLQVFGEATGGLLYAHGGIGYGSPIVSHGVAYLALSGVMTAFSL